MLTVFGMYFVVLFVCDFLRMLFACWLCVFDSTVDLVGRHLLCVLRVFHFLARACAPLCKQLASHYSIK